jgi:hypothetical protein
MTQYLKDPKDSTKKLLDIINTFGHVAGYKINMQKSVADEQADEEIRKAFPFTIGSTSLPHKKPRHKFN